MKGRSVANRPASAVYVISSPAPWSANEAWTSASGIWKCFGMYTALPFSLLPPMMQATATAAPLLGVAVHLLATAPLHYLRRQDREPTHLARRIISLAATIAVQ